VLAPGPVQERVMVPVPAKVPVRAPALVKVKEQAQAQVKVKASAKSLALVPVSVLVRWLKSGSWRSVEQLHLRHLRRPSTRGKQEALRSECVAHHFSAWETHRAFAEFELASASFDCPCGHALFLDAGHHSRIALFAPVSGSPIDQHDDAVAKADEEIDMRE
jgi:hypothetical protein